MIKKSLERSISIQAIHRLPRIEVFDYEHWICVLAQIDNFHFDTQP